MKYTVLLLCLLVSTTVKADWLTYKIDETVIVQLPFDPEVFDTLTSRSYIVETDYGLILITSIKNTIENNLAVNIHDLKSLNSYYKGISKTVLKQPGIVLLDSGRIDIHGHQAMQYYYQTVYPDSTYQITESIYLYLNGITYSINYNDYDVESDTLLSEKEKLFASIHFTDNIDDSSQFVGKSRGFLIGEMLGTIFSYALVPIIIIAIILIVRRKKG